MAPTLAHPAPSLLATDLRRALSSEATVRLGAPLGPRTTLGVGGPADVLVEPASEADLATTLRFATERRLPWRVLGRGSNLLVRDGGFRGLILALGAGRLAEVRRAGDAVVCGAGARLPTVAGFARREGLAGLEFLEGIPGSVGGALRMNAGAHGAWIFDVLESVRYLEADGEAREARASALAVRYRSCDFLATRVAVSAVLRGRREAPEAIAERMRDYARRRRATQPREPSAGCIFKNPPALPAGRLIDQLGLKGVQIGGARLSELHGNFIVNRSGATADDVLRLIELVRERAAAAGVELETEVEILGEDRDGS